jgi:uncharacterized protein YgbK (DUF1537 family)
MGERILLAFYGDDFSGTTATAEALFESGVPTLIFADPPDPFLLAKHFPAVRAVGVAGLARTLPAGELAAALSPVFRAFQRLRPPVLLYKVCSTFDSSAEKGSIGRAIEIGREIFNLDFVPVLPAAPRLGRYTIFGHHFAALGEGEVYRLDRHPSISKHPVTPMRESDLRLHLARQTSLEIALINILEVNQGPARVKQLLRGLREKAIPVVLFDCIEEKHMQIICRVIWKEASSERPVFIVGSQEIGFGLGDAWKKTGMLPQADVGDMADSGPERPLLVLSGSCATVTGRQIRWAAENAFTEVPVSPEKLLDPALNAAEIERVAGGCRQAILQNRSVIAHTAAGPEDPRIVELHKVADSLSLTPDRANRVLGDALGEIALQVLGTVPLRRLVIVGGDTAGRVQQHLQVRALQVARSIGIAAPLCYLYSANPELNGLEVAFKGGQIGTTDYFGHVRSAATRGFAIEALGSYPAS